MPPLAILALVLSGLFWGLGFPLGKLALAETGAAEVVLLRFVVATIVALPFALRHAAARAAFRAPAALAAGALYGLAFIIQFEGLARVSVTLAALLVGAMPALIAVAARLMGERVTRTTWAGVAAATAGALLIAGKPGGAGSVAGVLLSIGALFVFLAWLIVLRRAPADAGPMGLPCVTVVVATAAILPVTLILHGPPRLDLSAAAWAGIVGQGVFSTVLATAAWSYGAARVDSAQAGVFINIEPLMGAAIGVALFGDVLTWPLAAGGALIVAGSLAVVRGERRVATGPAADAPPTPA
ncbi:MAG: DMT family transporter [Sphingomonas fennica]